MKDIHWGRIRLKAIDLIRGTQIENALRELHIQQYWSKERLKKLENERFEELLKTAAVGSAQYKDKHSYDELEILTKDTIKKAPARFFSDKYSSNLTSKATGGSTGSPLIYYTTKEAQSYMWAGIIFSWQIAGYEFGDKVAFVAGPSIFKRDLKHKVFHMLLNVVTYSTFSLNSDDLEKYLEDIKERKIKIIYGYATALNRMAEYMIDNKIERCVDLKGIISTAEVLTEAHKENIEKAFGVKVYNQYGCNEGGVSAFECEENKLHLINTKCKFELDDDNNLIATDLINKGFFILRYFTGDKIIMAKDQQCACGRGFPVIDKVIGRSYDMVVDNKKKVLHAAFFNILFKQDPRIRQFQIQFNSNQISIFLNVHEANADADNYSKYIDIVKEHLSFDEYTLKINAPFLNSQNAKHKYVVNTAA